MLLSNLQETFLTRQNEAQNTKQTDAINYLQISVNNVLLMTVMHSRNNLSTVTELHRKVTYQCGYYNSTSGVTNIQEAKDIQHNEQAAAVKKSASSNCCNKFQIGVNNACGVMKIPTWLGLGFG